MSQVNGIGPMDGSRKILGDSLRRMAKVTPPPADAPVDKVEISPEAREMVVRARQERIQGVREEIANGTYETDEKWDVTIRRMVHEMFGRERQ